MPVRGNSGLGGDWVRFAYLHAHRSGGNPDFEIPGLKLDADVGWTRFVTPPVFGVSASPTKRWGLTTGCTPVACVLFYAMHYTRKLGRCPILNKIHQEGTKGHEGKRGIWIDDPFGSAQDRFSVDCLLFWDRLDC